jgi:hypothetical protein
VLFKRTSNDESQLGCTGHINVWIVVQRKNLVLEIQVQSFVELQILYLLGYKGNFFTNRKSEKNAPRFSAIYSGPSVTISSFFQT